ncbi:hypothetical protein FHS18_005750 [Paenibacillus phyllosphaerae]|uniref:Glycosyltransferase 2-like domain-containing protein n=1 Tax=Paenibacillus phyllosphaerae TaxID=274593 RepID=A0A7W5FQV8_9BACL|nr:glycosyltransferase [Paenibacillus phyllosphaerae]MBB3113637.1 hypothetical protein [Paenibacillus phyllosphaerae]
MQRTQRVKQTSKRSITKRNSVPNRQRQVKKRTRRPTVASKREAPVVIRTKANVQQATAIVCGYGTESPQTIRQLAKLGFAEIIAVLGREEEAAYNLLRQLPEVTLIYMPVRLAPHEARSIGASVASGNVLLFVDGKAVLDDQQVLAQLAAIEHGADVALADQMPRLGAFQRWGDADRVRAFVNWSLGCPELQANSIEHLPHAWTREGAATVGRDNLRNPAFAQEAAIAAKLRIQAVPSSLTRLSSKHQAGVLLHELAQLSLGDHVEALTRAMKTTGGRLQFADRVRKRHISGGGQR